MAELDYHVSLCWLLCDSEPKFCCTWVEVLMDSEHNIRDRACKVDFKRLWIAATACDTIEVDMLTDRASFELLARLVPQCLAVFVIECSCDKLLRQKLPVLFFSCQVGELKNVPSHLLAKAERHQHWRVYDLDWRQWLRDGWWPWWVTGLNAVADSINDPDKVWRKPHFITRVQNLIMALPFLVEWSYQSLRVHREHSQAVLPCVHYDFQVHP